MNVISRLLSRFGVTDDASEKTLSPRAADLKALRRRMTPLQTAGVPSTATQAPRKQSYVLPLRTSPPALDSLSWLHESSEADWKPVVLSELEMTLPVVPSLDELAEEGGIAPTEPRFPFDA